MLHNLPFNYYVSKYCVNNMCILVDNIHCLKHFSFQVVDLLSILSVQACASLKNNHYAQAIFKLTCRLRCRTKMADIKTMNRISKELCFHAI